jgi:hypothetical protein
LALHILTLLGDLLPPLCQLRQADRLSLIGVEQTRIGPRDALQP